MDIVKTIALVLAATWLKEKLQPSEPKMYTADFQEGRDWFYHTGSCPSGWRKQLQGTRSERCTRLATTAPYRTILASTETPEWTKQ